MTQQIKSTARPIKPESNEADLHDKSPKKVMGRMEKILQDQAQRNVLRPSNSTFRNVYSSQYRDVFAF